MGMKGQGKVLRSLKVHQKKKNFNNSATDFEIRRYISDGFKIPSLFSIVFSI